MYLIRNCNGTEASIELEEDRSEMADVGKLTGSGSARGVVTDIREARARSGAAQQRRRDSAGFSERACELSRAGAAVQETSEVRAEKIRALRAQIQAGEYRPDPRAIAESILERGL